MWSSRLGIHTQSVDVYSFNGNIHVCSTHLCKCFSVQGFTLHEQLSLLETKLKNSMDKYCLDLVSQGVPEDDAQDLALKARSKPKEHPRCKRIYQDYQELVKKQSQIDRFGS